MGLLCRIWVTSVSFSEQGDQIEGKAGSTFHKEWESVGRHVALRPSLPLASRLCKAPQPSLRTPRECLRMWDEPRKEEFVVQKRAKPIPEKIFGWAHGIGRGPMVSLYKPVPGKADLRHSSRGAVLWKSRGSKSVLGPNQCIQENSLQS